MITPYDWQEGIGNRAQYVENRLEQGAPVIALSTDAGIVVFTYRRQSPKIFEIYDRIVFAAIGQQSDVEAIRIAAVEFAHREGYSRSEDDVTISRLVSAVSTPIKQAFGGFNNSPIVARSLFAELGETRGEDAFYVVDYDGDYRQYDGGVVLVGSGDERQEALSAIDRSRPTEEIVGELHEIWKRTVDPNGEGTGERYAGLTPEALLLERIADRENLFRPLDVPGV